MTLPIFIGPRLFEAEGLFFDKDGPLVDFRHQYTVLMDKRMDLIMAQCPKDSLSLRKEIGRAVGYNVDSREIDPRSPFAIATPGDNIAIVAGILFQHGMPWDSAYPMVDRAFSEASQQIKLEQLIRPMQGLFSVLSSLKENGLVLACLTNDSGRRAKAVLETLNVSAYFNLIIGADEVTRPKPDPEMFQAACQRLDLSPRRVAFVGDSVSDMVMAKKGGAGLAVGIVAGGVSTRAILNETADIVIDDLEAISIQGQNRQHS